MARKMKSKGEIKKKFKKDDDIPNSYPHKGQMIDALIKRKLTKPDKKKLL
jgi:hypothetical protein